MCGQMAVHNQFCMDIFKFCTDIVPLCRSLLKLLGIYIVYTGKAMEYLLCGYTQLGVDGVIQFTSTT